LNSEKNFHGKGDELIGNEILDEDDHVIARTEMSSLISVKIRGQSFACKISWIRSDDTRKAFEKELDNLRTVRSLPHLHVVQLMCYYTKPECNEGPFILSPLAECNLKEYLSGTPTLDRKLSVAKWFGCLIAGLHNIHLRDMKHKDIKLDNILIHGSNIIITDLGISNKFLDSSLSTGDSPGSFAYMAPEV
jgi:serine/threonine protein kinase